MDLDIKINGFGTSDGGHRREVCSNVSGPFLRQKENGRKKPCIFLESRVMPESTEHRPDKKPKQVDPRAIRRQHKWRFGHDPRDDDATPESGWKYIRWDPYTETPPNQIKEVVGGPEAFECDRCHAMMRIVAKKKPTEIIENSDVIRLGEQVDVAKVNTDDVYLVACPQCDRRTQMPGRFLRELVYRKTGRLIS